MDRNGSIQYCDFDGPPKVSGINKVFGDGHAEWKDRKEFDIDNIPLCLPETPHVKGWIDTVGNFY